MKIHESRFATKAGFESVKDGSRMSRREKNKLFIARLTLVLLLIGFAPIAAFGQGGDSRDGNPGCAGDIMSKFFDRNGNARCYATTEYGGADVLVRTDASQGLSKLTNGVGALLKGNLRGAMQAASGQDGTGPKKSQGPGQVKTSSGPTYIWPAPVPAGIPSAVPTKRDEAINKNELTTFGYPVSDTQFQLIQRYDQNIMLENLSNPERFMWTASALGGLQSTSAANSAGNMATNQAISAIDFSKKYLVNFTAEQGNVWHRLRDQLFIPMAILLLLPGAVLAQVKAIVAQGSPVWAQADSPIEGITRSIVAIFLIPATFLVINYGIDVSNSITFTIADEYKRIFGTDMYEDAICHEKRAFATNPSNRQENAIHQKETPTNRGTSVWSAFEGLNSTVREYDPCLGIDNTRVPDENAVQAKNWGRLSKNVANTGITAAWNIMSAFQMAYLYYLWCMGPIAAALWVWPIAPMRRALASWIEGVITLCFWSLFWNTTILLLACFKGVGDDGSVIVTALNTLANLAVKKAFDFAGLVTAAGAAASDQMSKAMQGGGQGGGKSGGGSGGGAGGAPGRSGTGASGSNTGGGPNGGTLTGPGSGPGGNESGGALALSPMGGSLNSGALIPSGGNLDPKAVISGFDENGVAVDPGLPPTDRTAMGTAGGANDATERAALAALGMSRGGPPSAEDNAAFNNLKALDDKGHPAATATMEALARTQQGDLQLAASGNSPEAQAAAQRIKDATGMSASTLNDALRGDPTAMMTAAAVVGAAGSAGGAAQLMAKAEAGDPNARAQLEARTGLSADVLMSAAGGNESSQMNVLARSGLDDSVREAALNGDSIAQSAVRNADLMYSRDTTTGDYTQISAFDASTGKFNATDAQGNVFKDDAGTPLISYDTTTGSYRTADGGGVSYDSTTGNWLARDANGSTNGGIVYDVNDRRFETAGTNAPVEYSNGNFVASGTGGNIVWDAQQNRFQDAATGAVVMSDPGGSGQWFRVAQDGQSIERFAGGSAGQASWERAANAPVEMRNGEIVAANTNGNVLFDQAQGRYEARNVDAGVTYDQSSGNWYAQGASGQVAYDVNNAQFRATGTSEAVSYTGGQWAVDNTGGRVVLDASQGRYEVAGANAPVSYDQSNNTWVGAGTGGEIRYDRADSRFETSNGAVAVVDPNGSGRWYAAAADGSVSMLAPTGSGQPQWTSAGPDSPVSYSNGAFVAQGSGGSVFYDQKDGQWEYRQATQSGGYAETNVAMARDSSSGNWVAANTGGQVVLDPASRQLEIYGTNTAVARDATGSYVAANTGGSVFLDSQNPGGARWEVRGTDAPVVQDSRGQWTAADSRGAVVWDAQQNRFEQAGSNTPVYRDPAGSGWYAVGANGMVSAMSYDQSGSPQWRSVDPQTAPIRVDQGGVVSAANTNGMIQFDQRDNRWEIAGTNQAVQYDARSQQWVAPESGGKVAYDFTDKRLEVMGSNGATTNVPVVSDPAGRGYYAFAADGQVHQLNAAAGTWRPIDQSAGVAYAGGQLISTASIAPGDQTRTPQIAFDTAQGRWEVTNNPNPAYNGVPVTQVGGGFYADNTGRQIEYDLNKRAFNLAGSDRPVEYSAQTGSWNYAGTTEQVALRSAEGSWTAGTHSAAVPDNYQFSGGSEMRTDPKIDPFSSVAHRMESGEMRPGYVSHPAHIDHSTDYPTQPSAVMDARRVDPSGGPAGTAAKVAVTTGMGAVWQQWANSIRLNRGASQNLQNQLFNAQRGQAGGKKKGRLIYNSDTGQWEEERKS